MKKQSDIKALFGKMVRLSKTTICCWEPGRLNYGHWYIKRSDLATALADPFGVSSVRTWRRGGNDEDYVKFCRVGVRTGQHKIGCCQFTPQDFARIKKWARSK